MSRRHFRILLLVATICYLFWFLAPVLHSADPMSRLAQLRAASGYGAKLSPPVDAIIAWALLTARIVGTWALWVGGQWGKWVFGGSVAATLLASPFLGVAVQLPSEVFIGYLGTLLDGAVVAASFWPEADKHRSG